VSTDQLLGSAEALENWSLHNWGHWNEGPPGRWADLYRLKGIGRISKYCEPYCGVYRLVGLVEDKSPFKHRWPFAAASLDRVCGHDETGTLYIGSFFERRRLAGLILSCRDESWLSRDAHGAGATLRATAVLSGRFPVERLAVTWCYDARPALAEKQLLRCYRESFGELPPLNAYWA